MRSKAERLQKRQERLELRAQMMQMVEEANSLRDEAAEKMDGVRLSYRLEAPWADARFLLMSAGMALLAMVVIGTFSWVLDNNSVIADVMTIALVVGFLKMSFERNRPYKAEEHEEVYCVNQNHYAVLVQDLNRLKAGIAEYDRQYAEQEEYIQKFRERVIEVEDFGGSVESHLKAGDFHARVKIVTAMNEVNCRLKFNQKGYTQLLDIMRFFNEQPVYSRVNTGVVAEPLD